MKGELVAWYCEIPRQLRDDFDRLFPQRGSHTRLTIGALIRAVSIARVYEQQSIPAPVEVLDGVSGNEGNQERDRSEPSGG